MAEQAYDGQVKRSIFCSGGRVHFVGIGGVSMFSLARLTMSLGISVSGSDITDSHRTRTLSLLGAIIYLGHAEANSEGAGLVVYSHAIGRDNPELSSARERGIPTLSRAEYMGELMLRYRERVGVSGSHGKSTVTAMLDSILSEGGYYPTVLSGAELPCGQPIRLGRRGTLLYEACEYKDSFLHFHPTVAIALNLELDHTDYFSGMDMLSDSFSRALSLATRLAVINGDDPALAAIKEKIKAPTRSFGAGDECDYRFSVSSYRRGGFDFTVSRYKSSIGRFALNIPGSFNVYNATAAIVTAVELGVDIEAIRCGIGSFRGVPGRLQLIGRRRGRPVYLDYAHHPTEMIATIEALRTIEQRPITLVFKPHTYSRTAHLWEDFLRALSYADHVIVTDIYPAREEPIDNINSKRLAAEAGGIYCADEQVTATVDRYTDGTVILMGAGCFDDIRKNLLKEQEII